MQWNCNGITSRMKDGELQRLITDYNPACLCLQHLGKQNVNIKNYQLASEFIGRNKELGTAIYIHNDIIYDSVDINNSPLQLSATRMKINERTKITIGELVGLWTGVLIWTRLVFLIFIDNPEV